MANLGDLWKRCNDESLSSDVKEQACSAFGEQIRDILQGAYLSRYFKPRIPPLPDPYLRFDPTPTPVIEQLVNQQFLIGQLMLNALGDPSPQPSIFFYIQEQQLHLAAAKQLAGQLERAANHLREIAEAG
jgi:hypothetical protein